MKLILFLALLSGCSSNRTRITWHDGKVIEITGTGDQMVEVQLSSGTVKLDSRKSSMMRDMIQFLLIKMSNDNSARAR